MLSGLRVAVLAAISAGLCLAVSADAAATTYDVMFTSIVGSATPTGSLTYDL
jgi:hypothetical protein